MTLDKKDALALANALQAAGVKLEGLKAVNPWTTSDTPRSREIRWMLEAANPALANKFKSDAGHEDMIPSLAFIASEASGIAPAEMVGEAAADYARFNPQLIQEQQLKAEQDILAKLEKASEETRLSNRARQFGGDINAAKRSIEEEEKRDAARKQQAEQRAAEGRALELRIAAKQQQLQNEARIAAGNVIITN